MPKLNKYLDWFNILSYDYHSAYEPSVNHHAPLYPIEEENEYSYDTDLNIVSLASSLINENESFSIKLEKKMISFAEFNHRLLSQGWRRERQIGFGNPNLRSFLHALQSGI